MSRVQILSDYRTCMVAVRSGFRAWLGWLVVQLGARIYGDYANTETRDVPITFSEVTETTPEEDVEHERWHREAISVGDIVRLRSGGPEMTVDEWLAHGPLCVWFSGAHSEPRRCQFSQHALEKIRGRND